MMFIISIQHDNEYILPYISIYMDIYHLLYYTCIAAKITVLFVILQDLTLDYYIDLITVAF